jgi:hypothetical protein
MENQCRFSNFWGHVEGLVLCCFLRCVACGVRKPAVARLISCIFRKCLWGQLPLGAGLVSTVS